MPTLDKFRQYHYDATVKVSENTRTLALAGIGIVWLFKQQSSDAYVVPQKLLFPLVMVVSAMSFDFLQHMYRSIAWHIIFRLQEGKLNNKEIKEETELYVSDWINVPGYVFFYSKIVCLILAYWKLLEYFFKVVKWV
jgi:hypothetical protein